MHKYYCRFFFWWVSFQTILIYQMV